MKEKFIIILRKVMNCKSTAGCSMERNSQLCFEQMLSIEDRNYYENLKKTLSSQICRNCRNRRVESFGNILYAINCFVNTRKEDSWKRSLVCGVCWYKNYVCVNIRQMSILLEKCKSSINGSLQRLNLIVLQNKQQCCNILVEAMPYLKMHQDLLKMWSVRHINNKVAKISKTPQSEQNRRTKIPAIRFIKKKGPNISKDLPKKLKKVNEIAENDSNRKSQSENDFFDLVEDFDIFEDIM